MSTHQFAGSYPPSSKSDRLDQVNEPVLTAVEFAARVGELPLFQVRLGLQRPVAEPPVERKAAGIIQRCHADMKLPASRPREGFAWREYSSFSQAYNPL